jgi:hypothetical protein
VCRRAAEYEVRRVVRRLDAVDVERSKLRINLDGGGEAAKFAANPWDQRGRAQAQQRWKLELAALDREAARLDARLRELVAAGAAVKEG